MAQNLGAALAKVVKAATEVGAHAAHMQGANGVGGAMGAQYGQSTVGQAVRAAGAGYSPTNPNRPNPRPVTPQTPRTPATPAPYVYNPLTANAAQQQTYAHQRAQTDVNAGLGGIASVDAVSNPYLRQQQDIRGGARALGTNLAEIASQQAQQEAGRAAQTQQQVNQVGSAVGGLPQGMTPAVPDSEFQKSFGAQAATTSAALGGAGEQYARGIGSKLLDALTARQGQVDSVKGQQGSLENKYLDSAQSAQSDAKYKQQVLTENKQNARNTFLLNLGQLNLSRDKYNESIRQYDRAAGQKDTQLAIDQTKANTSQWNSQEMVKYRKQMVGIALQRLQQSGVKMNATQSASYSNAFNKAASVYDKATTPGSTPGTKSITGYSVQVQYIDPADPLQTRQTKMVQAPASWNGQGLPPGIDPNWTKPIVLGAPKAQYTSGSGSQSNVTPAQQNRALNQMVQRLVQSGWPRKQAMTAAKQYATGG